MPTAKIHQHLDDLRADLKATHRERDTHLQRADAVTTTALKQARRERLLHHGQVHTQQEAAIKLIRETKAAISEFESASDTTQHLGQKLDTALRGLGDVEHFLGTLSERTQKLSERIVKLLSAEEERREALDEQNAPTPQ